MSSEQTSSKPKPFSIAFSKPSPSASSASERVSQPSSQASTPRPPGVFGSGSQSRAKLQQDESEGEDDHLPAHEEVTGFDHGAGGAVNAFKRQPEEKAPRVIQVDSNNDWRGKIIRARKSLLPAEVQAQRAAQGSSADGVRQVEVEGPGTQYGLSYSQPRSEAPEDRRGTEATEGGTGEDTNMADTDTGETATTKPQTQEDLALQALIRESKGEGEAGTRKSDMVIEAQDHTNGTVHVEETEMSSFRADVASRPDSASVTDYDAVPVEEFGAALLRGMGWKEGERVGKGNYGDATSNQAALKAHAPERRPGYLGIGAKDISGKAGSTENEIGAWGKSAMRKAKKPGEGLYTPVMMRSKKTGEKITEDEFKTLQKEGTQSSEDWKERRDRNLQKHGRDSRRRDYEDDEYGDDHRRSGDSPKHEDGSLSPDRNRRRRKQYDDHESERQKGDRRHRDRDRDRERHRDRDDRGRDDDRDRKYRSSRRSPDEDSSSRRSSRRHDSRADRHEHRSSDRDRDRLGRRREDY